jgi:hypothetical protein
MLDLANNLCIFPVIALRREDYCTPDCAISQSFQACMYDLGRGRKKRVKPLIIGVLEAAIIHRRRARIRVFGLNPQIVSGSEIRV